MKKKEEAPEVEKKEMKLPAIGDMVLFTKAVQTQQGSRIEHFPAIVTAYPKTGESNFQPKDMAVDLVILGQVGAPLDHKRSVMGAEKATGGRWSHR